jgi:hypothetical protein
MARPERIRTPVLGDIRSSRTLFMGDIKGRGGRLRDWTVR